MSHRGWTRLSCLPIDETVYALCTDPTVPDYLWAGLVDGAIWSSSDRGDTWECLEGRLPSVDTAMVLLSPSR